MIQEDQGQCSSHQAINNFQTYHQEHHQLLLQQQIMSQQNSDIFGFNHHHHMFPSGEVPWSMPQVQSFNQASPYPIFFNRSRVVPSSSLQFAYHDHHHHHQVQPGSSSSAPFGLQAEIGKMSAQEIMEAKALAASKSHSEAERRRRERINNHLAKLRSLLPSTTKTDKASLLAEVIQHVKELKRQTSLIAETSPVPTEADELTVDAADDEEDNGKFVIKASLCCEDRTDILPELIKTLKALRLRTLKADITTLGGRMKNVLFITGDDDNEDNCSSRSCIISSIQEALKAVMEKSVGDESGNVKRQRTNIV